MRDSKKYSLYSLLAVLLFFAACKKEIIEDVVYDNVIYEVDTVPVYGTAAEKTKLKTNTQLLTILYGDLFKLAIPVQDLNKMEEWILSLGDKQAANELLICGFLNSPIEDLPTDTEMRADIDQFIIDTYLRFYLRKPTELEKYQLKKIIEEDISITPQDVYLSFALSNEYLYY